MNDRQREGQPLDQALLAKFADLRLRLVQVDALVNMLALRPHMLDQLLPLLSEAANPEPTFGYRPHQHRPPQADVVKDPHNYIPQAEPKRAKVVWAKPADVRGVPERWVRVLELMADGLETPKIAEKLYLSFNTVKGHRQEILRHFGTGTAAGAVAQAMRAGVIE